MRPIRNFSVRARTAYGRDVRSVISTDRDAAHAVELARSWWVVDNGYHIPPGDRLDPKTITVTEIVPKESPQ